MAKSSSVALPQWCSIVRSKPAVFEREAFTSFRRIITPRDAVAFLRPTLIRSETEMFVAVSVNSQHEAFAVTRVSVGLLNETAVHARETFRVAIAMNARAVIVAHNHPSGDPAPSQADREATSMLVAAGRILDIPVFDHIIIANDKYFSFAESGLL
jgi:DNA repair protein RadC